MKDNETRAWQAWKTTCYTMLGHRTVVNRRTCRCGGLRYKIRSPVTCGMRKQMCSYPRISSTVMAEPHPPIDLAVM